MCIEKIATALPWLTLALCCQTANGDTLEEVRTRMQLKGAIQLRYEETRHLELMNDPWHGQGYLIAAEPDKMVKLQIQPQREIMGAYDNRMVYFDAQRQIRHSASISDDNAIGLQVLAFQAIVHGDFTKLEPFYSFDFSENAGQWTIRLTPKPETAALDLAQITLQGKSGEAADHIELKQRDGDRSELRLEKTEAGKGLDATVSRLFLEALGN